MRVLIALILLLLQGSPFVGAALCLHATSAPNTECEMGEHGTGDTGFDAGAAVTSHAVLVATDDGTPDDCGLAAACTASAPAVAAAPPAVRQAAAPDASVSNRLATLQPGDTRAPPHNPPRV